MEAVSSVTLKIMSVLSRYVHTSQWCCMLASVFLFYLFIIWHRFGILGNEGKVIHVTYWKNKQTGKTKYNFICHWARTFFMLHIISDLTRNKYWHIYMYSVTEQAQHPGSSLSGSELYAGVEMFGASRTPLLSPPLFASGPHWAWLALLGPAGTVVRGHINSRSACFVL